VIGGLVVKVRVERAREGEGEERECVWREPEEEREGIERTSRS